MKICICIYSVYKIRKLPSYFLNKKVERILRMVIHLQSRVFYGLKTDIISNAHYISDAEILYPVGNVIALHNIPQYRQRFIRLSDKQQINIITVTYNK